MIPTIVGRQLVEGLKQHLEAQFPVRTPFFEGLWDRFFDPENGAHVLKGPWLSIPLPFRKDTTEAARTRFSPALDRLAFPPYAHQVKAWDRIERFLPTLVATGTGSGKTECFTYPVLRHCAAFKDKPGIRAIFIYPMNALASDQAKRLAKLVAENAGLNGIRVGLYIGDDRKKGGGRGKGAKKLKPRSKVMTSDSVITDQETIRQSPPHILLTNYKMLDYMLVRPKEAALWIGNSPGVLRFLAVDELHTFDGAQAADLACLVRRLKERLRIDDGDPAQRLCCIGTSATMGSGPEAARSIADFASKVFDASFDAAALIGEDRLSPDEALPPPDGPAFPASTAFLPLPGEEPTAYLARQRTLWGLAKSEDILKRPFVQEAIRRLADGPQDIRALASTLAKTAQAADWTDPPPAPATAEAALRSACALLSDLRAKKGRDYPEVRLQLWAREIARMAADLVPKDPRLVFSDDLSDPGRLRDETAPGGTRHYLPLLNCRECGCTGYLAFHNRDRQKLEGGRTELYRAHIGRGDRDLALLVPLNDGEERPAHLTGQIVKICPHCKGVLPESAKKCPGCGAEDLLRAAEEPAREIGRGGQRRHALSCPACGAGADGLLLIGMRSATLLSHFIGVLAGSHFNADRKLIAFSDNVQDSSHRAGFFGGRTWSATFRTHLSQFLAEWLPAPAGSAPAAPRPLHEACDAFREWLDNRYPDSRDLYGMLLPQDLKDLPAWHDLTEKPKEPAPHATAVGALHYRLRWETVQEFGLRSNIGRTLPRLGIAEAVPLLPAADDPVWASLADGLSNRTESLRVFAGRPDLLRGAVESLARQMIATGAFDDGAGVVRRVAAWGNLFALQVRDNAKRGNPYFDGLLRRQSEGKLHLLFPAKRIGDGGTRKLLALIAPLKPASRMAEAVATAGATLDEASLLELLDALADANLLESVEDQGHRVLFRLLPKERVGVRLLDGSTTCSPLFRNLFLTGAMHRVNAAEHTGLLDRDEREGLERKFKEKNAKSWYPNLVSATPTLEMGVDIGDLSTVLLCSIPPTQAKYLQRIGRSGRANGSALNMAVAAAKPHDLYFFADPEEMLRGQVGSPGVFLDASEILCRQYLAFVLGEWLLTPGNPGLPLSVKHMLAPLDLPPGDPARSGAFPEAFFVWYSVEVAANLLGRFLDRLQGINRTTIQALDAYATPPPSGTGSELEKGIRNEIAALKSALKGYDIRCRSLRDRIRDVKKDESLTPEKREEIVGRLEREKIAWGHLLGDRNKQTVLEWLCDTAGLLPNYTFPEPGIELQALLWRKEDGGGKPFFDRIEVARPASSGLTELVPGATFFTHGHRCDIDQVDLAATGIDAQNRGELWRFCPACDYMERVDSGNSAGTCPVCGADWSDGGQVRTLLRAKQFITVQKAQDAIVDDSTDERRPLFHDCKKFFVRQSDDDLSFASEDEEHPFGYEFIRHLNLVEVNFGRATSGRGEAVEAVEVNGRRIFGGSFHICPECGKAVDSEPGTRSRRFHTATCSHSRNGEDGRDEDDMEQEEEGEILADFYRTYSTEALRIFAPFLGESDDERIASFMAALQLGLQKKFGGEVDHLQMQLESLPAGPHGARRNFVILYDGIPGGSGYLRQFVKDGGPSNLVFEIMQLALDALRNCTCATDPDKDGCYRCLYRYRNQSNQEAISRRAAIEVLEGLLRNRTPLKKIASRRFLSGNFHLAHLLESELERRFIMKLKQEIEKRGGRFEYGCVLGYDQGVRITFPHSDGKERVWEAVPQQPLGPADGVLEWSCPDIVFHPVEDAAATSKPVAVFLDGWEYHRPSIGDDLVKRMAIAKSGRYRVWSLVWQDVVPPPSPPERPAWRDTLCSNAIVQFRRAIFGKLMQDPDAGNTEANHWRTAFNEPDSEMDRLLVYLAEADDARFERRARAEALALFTRTFVKTAPPPPAIVIPSGWGDIQPAANVTAVHLPGASARLGLGAGSEPLLAASFDDQTPENISEADWRSFFSFVNFFQTLDGFLAFSEASIGHPLWQKLRTASTVQADGAWAEALECAEGDERMTEWLRSLQNDGTLPPEVFADLARPDGEVVGCALMFWADKRLAIVEDAVDASVLGEGWTILSVPEDGSDDKDFINNIKATLAAS